MYIKNDKCKIKNEKVVENSGAGLVEATFNGEGGRPI
tara:strand:- start:564 stop:674 length:111 start_codon:yes stop_codon:yes gene_type:complete